eukprot:7380188-Prymnesium_polylepis.2
MAPPWQWRHSDCASQQARCAYRRLARCAAPPDTPRGTTPTYRAKTASLYIPSVVISTALINLVGMIHTDRATTAGATYRPPKSSWGGYWASWLFGRICEKCTLRSLG